MLGLLKAKNTEKLKAATEELSESIHLPFTHHYDRHTICNKDGSMFQVLSLQGIPFETIDDVEITTEKEARNELFSALDEYTGIYTYTIGREEKSFPKGIFKAGTFPEELNSSYLNIHNSRQAFVNEHYLVVVRIPHTGAQKSLHELFQVFHKPHRAKLEREYKERRDALSQTVLEIIKRLKAYNPKLLTVKGQAGKKLSEPLEFLNLLINHSPSTVMLPKMDISKYLPASRHIFGREIIEIRYPHKTRYAAIIAIKEYGTSTDAGMLDDLLQKPIEITISQTYLPIDRQRALKLMADAQRLLIQSEDYAESQAIELQNALDELASGKMSVGEHSFNILVFADSQQRLLDNIATVNSELGVMGGLRPVREDLNLENAYWSMLPGNGAYITRGTPITSRNFAGFASFHNQPIGKRASNHWGPAVSVLSTRQGTPFFFNFHDHDLGHTTLIGPSGYGKTLLLCFLLAQCQKYQPRMIYMDYEKGADIFIKAIGGIYRDITPETKTGWNPLLLPDTPENRAFLFDWLCMLLTTNDEALSATDKETIEKTVIGNYALKKEERTLKNIAPFLGVGTAESLAGRLKQWYGEGNRAYLFDNPTDELDISQGITGFDMTHLLKDRVGRSAAFFYLYHRIEQALDGNPTIIPIDEAWVFFRDDYFATRLEEKLKIIRRKNGIFIMGTNDVSDAAKSKISSTLITQSATNIFFGNNKASIDEYKKFGLSEKEIEIIRGIKKTDHQFLYKQGHNSVVLKLDLTGLEKYIPLLSSRKENAIIADELIKSMGPEPEKWIPAFVNTLEEAQA